MFDVLMRRGFMAALLLGLCLPAVLQGQYVLEDVQDKERYGPGGIILPFVFYTPSYRMGGGLVWSRNGFFQPQDNYYAFGYASINNSYGITLGAEDVQLHPFDRLFLDSEGGFAQESVFTAFLDGNGRFHGPAGTNSSSKQDFFDTRDDDGYGHFTFKYLLPIGGGKDVIINHYVLRNGLLESGAVGGQGWNPLTTGRTFLEVTPFFEFQTLQTPLEELHVDTNGLRFGFTYDNTDFPLNPSSGNITRFTLSRDFGWFNSSDTWLNLTEEFSQYINLGRSFLFRQQVLAFDAWTSYSPTWDESFRDGHRFLRNAPPFYEGAVLGGSERLRGFADNRFYDRAAVYGSVELRLVPNWNPFRKIAILREADITWMQWVIFAETGRVANEFSPNIFTHLKGDAGFGLRLLAKDTLLRLDVAASSEGFSVWARLGQSF